MHVKVLQNAPTEHSAILLTCNKLPPVFKTFVLSILVAFRQVLLYLSKHLVLNMEHSDRSPYWLHISEKEAENC